MSYLDDAIQEYNPIDGYQLLAMAHGIWLEETAAAVVRALEEALNTITVCLVSVKTGQYSMREELNEANMSRCKESREMHKASGTQFVRPSQGTAV